MVPIYVIGAFVTMVNLKYEVDEAYRLIADNNKLTTDQKSKITYTLLTSKTHRNIADNNANLANEE